MVEILPTGDLWFGMHDQCIHNESWLPRKIALGVVAFRLDILQKNQIMITKMVKQISDCKL